MIYLVSIKNDFKIINSITLFAGLILYYVICLIGRIVHLYYVILSNSINDAMEFTVYNIVYMFLFNLVNRETVYYNALLHIYEY